MGVVIVASSADAVTEEAPGAVRGVVLDVAAEIVVTGLLVLA